MWCVFVCVRESSWILACPGEWDGRECCARGEVSVESVCEEDDNSGVGVTRGTTTDTTKGDGARL